MKQFIILITTFLLISSFAQDSIVNIPDPGFLRNLKQNGADRNGDGKIQLSEARSIIKLNLVWNVDANVCRRSCPNTQDITGIEAFTNLKELSCTGLQGLKIVYIPESIELKKLTLRYFMWDSLNIENKLSLESLTYSPQKESCDFSKFTNLKELSIGLSPVKMLDISQNISLIEFSSFMNSQLKTICVNPIHNAASNPDFKKDSTSIWSEVCNPLGVNESNKSSNLVIIKALNLQGQEVPIDTKNKVIILLYDNGKRVKVYITD